MDIKGLLIAHVGTGGLPKYKAKEHLNSVRDDMKDCVPNDVKFICVSEPYTQGVSFEFINYNGNENEQINKIIQSNNKEQMVHVRVTQHEKSRIKSHAESLGFRTISEYLRFVGLLKPTYEIVNSEQNGLTKVEQSRIILEEDEDAKEK